MRTESGEMSEHRRAYSPRARSDGLIVRHMADETLVYDERCDRMHCLNRSASLVWARCDGAQSVMEIARGLAADLDGPIGEDVVWYALARLDHDGLLTEPLPVRQPAMSRRALMTLAGVGALLTIPAISSIAVPTAAQASSCLGTGASCAAGAQCCSGVCSSGVCL